MYYAIIIAAFTLVAAVVAAPVKETRSAIAVPEVAPRGANFIAAIKEREVDDTEIDTACKMM